jgi:glycosyltransferase involved in cell wall biosynthesis
MKLLVPLPFDLTDLAHGRNLRVAGFLRGLESRVDLTVLVPDRLRIAQLANLLPKAELIAADGLESNGEQGTSKTSIERCLSYFDSTPALSTAAMRIAARFDITLGFDFATLPCLHRIKAAHPDAKMVCDLIDDPLLTWRSMEWQNRYSVSGIKSLLALKQVRAHVPPQCDAIITAGGRDAEVLRASGIHGVHIIPNGVDVEPESALQTEREQLAVFTGYMNFPPNEAAAMYLVKYVWPGVRELLQRDGASRMELALVGAAPSNRLIRMARRAGVIVTGRVDSVRDWLKRARVAIAPMQTGSGIKNKVLEACACGCPVLTTPLGASNLPTGSDNGILYTSSAREMIELAYHLLVSPDDANALGRAGYAMVANSFTWSAVCDRLFETLQRCGAISDRTRGADSRCSNQSTICNTKSETREEEVLNASS